MVADGVPLESVELQLDFSEYALEPESFVWVPDEMTLSIRRPTEDGTDVMRLTWTCLEHLLLLLDQIESGRSDTILSGTGLVRVEQSDDRVAIHTRPKLVGPRDEMRDAIAELVREAFLELESRGLDTESAARFAERRFSDEDLDVISIHDRLLDDESESK
ncbi:hypothetical protein [Halorussus ruber]|uniref:hypothetical protein n=1 Tax=Halorussus ruber TaxID=1126238 RepID=UPI001091B5F9|nr:hypothetical protein [Halorussus ruber]